MKLPESYSSGASSEPDPIMAGEELLAHAKSVAQRILDRIKKVTADTSLEVDAMGETNEHQPFDETQPKETK